MSRHARIADSYLRRLAGAAGSSALLKVRVARTGRLLDCSRLAVVHADLPDHLLQAIISGGRAVSVDLRLLAQGQNRKSARNEREGLFSDRDEAEGTEPASRKDEHEQLYDLLDRRIRRHAELARRETGVHALWFGYPLLYVRTGEGDAQQWILAPVLLWPVQIEPDLRHEGRLRIRRDRETGDVQFNRAMATWIRRQLQLDLPVPSQEELLELNWPEIGQYLNAIAQQFQEPPSVHVGPPLVPVPTAKLLSACPTARFFNAAVLGYVRWQNEAILADLEFIKNEESVQGVVGPFLTGTRLAESTEKVPLPAEEDRYLVRDADFSQQKVIWQARQGPGLVVHGPPGTGKSETIVNIIADALARHKTVLMVCQKQAATRVVLERLRAVGLADLCIEVHDPELDRQAVFKAIREQVENLPHQQPPPEQRPRTEFARRITALEAELDRFARGLHERHRTIGISYRQMKAREGQYYTKFPTVRLLDALQRPLGTLSAQQLDELCGRVETLGRLFQEANPFQNPWRLRQPTLQLSAALRSDISAIANELRTLDYHHQERVKHHGAGMPLPANAAEFQSEAPEILQRLRMFAEEPNSSSARLTLSWLKAIRGCSPDHVEGQFRRSRQAIELAAQVENTSHDSSEFGPLLAQAPQAAERLRRATKMFLAYRDRRWRNLSPWFWLSQRRVRMSLAEVRPSDSSSEIWTDAQSLLRTLDALHLRAELVRMNGFLIPNSRLRPKDENGQVSFPRLALKGLEAAADLCRKKQRHPWLSLVLNAALSDKETTRVSKMLEEVDRAVQRAPIAKNMLDTLAGLESSLIADGLADARRNVLQGKSIGPWLDSLIHGLDGLQALMALDLDRPRREGALRDIVEVLENYESRLARREKVPAPPRELSPEEHGTWWKTLVQFTAARVWQARCEGENPGLVELTPDIHAAKVKQLGELLHQKKALEAGAIRSQWLVRQVEYRKEAWKQMFQLRRGTQGDAKRLREAVELSLDRGLLAVRPCWLADPAAVCQIFPRIRELFDVVIFDEASQCPVEQAVPVIYRGKVVIVSGDEKQLPPTSFFSARAPDEEIEDNESALEATQQAVLPDARRIERMGENYVLQVEDLLEAAIGLFPDQQYLCVHYRSEHPALIDFSNHAFYSGRLEAAPSRLGLLGDDRPIQYFDAAGIYDRRTNHVEAKKVVEVLKTFWLGEGACPTIGVITFNQPQREEVEDLIQKECHDNPAFEARYQQELARKDANQDVGFFVKNLENVQGDERDVMVFSTTFGRDTEGRFYRRFGPVGAEGGERRLNVAVTRAKRRVIVVGSMPIDEISTALKTDLAPGSGVTPAGYLQLYLAYAQAISKGDQKAAAFVLGRLGRQSVSVSPTGGGPESPFEEEVLKIIERLGYQVHCQVGEAGFRIDLAVLHPDSKRGYALAVECDGASYHSDRSARTRDVWRQEILARYGWRIHRIWSTQWWYNRNEQVQKLKTAIEDAIRN